MFPVRQSASQSSAVRNRCPQRLASKMSKAKLSAQTRRFHRVGNQPGKDKCRRALARLHIVHA